MKTGIGKLLRLVGLYDCANRCVDHLEERRRRKRAKPFFRQFVQSGALVFDVGANIGARAQLFLELGARVVCIEPLEECCKALRARFQGNADVTIVPKGLDEAEGERVIRFGRALDVSSMSEAWIDTMRQQDRLPPDVYSWDGSRTVQVTTLERLIAENGLPAFCKIDVEGFDLSVLKGLKQPLPRLSIEFTPEQPDASYACVAYLSALGDYRFNYARGDNMQLDSRAWMTRERILDYLREKATQTQVCGDIYAVQADLV